MSTLEPTARSIALEPDEPRAKVEDPSIDRRPRLPEPPPVLFTTVENATLPAPSGLETELEWFYRDLLGFVREEDQQSGPVFKAANFRLSFTIVEPPIRRDNLHPLGITVESLFPVEAQLLEREYPFAWQKSISGSRSILLLDPAGNWIEVAALAILR